MLKKSLVLMSFSISFFGFSQVHWMTPQEVVEAQKTSPKKILLEFYSPDCESCSSMESVTFNQAQISNYINENFYPIKFNAKSTEKFFAFNREFNGADLSSPTSYHEFAKYLNITATPTLVFLDEQSNIITKLQGFFSAKELEPYVSGIARNEHQKISSKEQWQQYQKKFRSKIKD